MFGWFHDCNARRTKGTTFLWQFFKQIMSPIPQFLGYDICCKCHNRCYYKSLDKVNDSTEHYYMCHE